VHEEVACAAKRIGENVKTAFVYGLLCVVSALGLNAHGAVCFYS